MFDPKIELKDYQYILPEERIAKFPLVERDQSKLLHVQNGKISHHHFYNLPDLLDSDSLLVYNNTKVIPARLIFQRETGARIEIFLLQPIAPSTVIPEIMLSTQDVSWEVMIGNAKKWKDGEVLKGQISYQGQRVVLEARLENRQKQLVSFHWESDDISFVSLVEASGEVPLPPYLNRKPVAEDKSRYQTVYSKKEGAVAAPTAGLHFTEEVFDQLRRKGIKEAELTLHVSAGTFQPIKVANITEHAMHSEQIHIQRETIQQLLEQKGKTIAVGTTSVRSLESLYWFGVKILEENNPAFFIEKLFPYKERTKLPPKKQALQAVLDQMDRENQTEIMGSTEIFIFPGYPFQMIEGLITNFHQPGSTLVLLIAAILGEDWKKVYQEALDQNYRFLSYGDSSLLWI
ncbi:S-adenosylmethionine:tRNA ribosyltransferase-isomerase [Algoriphagus sp.]|uniref:S-adenosylmethionine:tRNA ribosyltransferase-isomerase n=1 Tax=Algoriphagus sp. TaxID=1872435 RepID=UPI0026198F0E|nr:S-adenosylmethionine:tRNA ribosyltransferase-isomerase [Algoriphagus sp.]